MGDWNQHRVWSLGLRRRRESEAAPSHDALPSPSLKQDVPQRLPRQPRLQQRYGRMFARDGPTFAVVH